MNRVGQWLRYSRNQEGQSVVFFALVLVPVLIAILALALDGGLALVDRTQMQAAADMAAIAGARETALNHTGQVIYNAVNEYAVQRNRAGSFTARYAPGNAAIVANSATPPAGTTGVCVTTQHTYQAVLANMIGFNTFPVAATACAKATSVGAMDNLLPMTINCANTFSFGTVYMLWDNTTAADAPGAVGWLSWNGTSSNTDLVNNILHVQNSGTRKVGDTVSAGPGVQNSSGVKAALDSWRNQPVTIPLFDQVTGSGSNTKYHICAFARFILLDYDFGGGSKWVSGSFTRIVTASQPGGNAPNYGVYALQLSQ